MRYYRLKVKEIAAKRGISQRQLFFKTAVDPNVIRKIFNDDANPTIDTLARLARGLGCDVSELIESVIPEDDEQQNK